MLKLGQNIDKILFSFRLHLLYTHREILLGS